MAAEKITVAAQADVGTWLAMDLMFAVQSVMTLFRVDSAKFRSLADNADVIACLGDAAEAAKLGSKPSAETITSLARAVIGCIEPAVKALGGELAASAGFALLVLSSGAGLVFGGLQGVVLSLTVNEPGMEPPRHADTGAALDVIVVFSESRSILRVSERFIWRLSLLALTLSKCRGQAASTSALHALSWSLQSASTRALARRWWNEPGTADIATLRTDPRLNTTISIAAAEDLVEVTSTGRVELTERGKELGALIDRDRNVLAEEKSFLRDLAPINDAQVSKRIGGLGLAS